MPIFSVVVPLFNKERYVIKAIESILGQSFSDFELLIVDDCSTDKSRDVVDTISDPRVRILRHGRNSGLSAARNTGIKHAAAEIIAFLDADDQWLPFFLEKIYEMVQKFPSCGIYATGYDEVYQDDRKVGVRKNLGDHQHGEMKIIENFFQANSHQPIFCYSSVAIKKNVFERAGLFDERISLGEDVDFNIRANLEFPFAYYNRSCAEYTIFSENQITTSAIEHKIITDFKKYEKFATGENHLKKYLDVNRYILAMQYKLSGLELKSQTLEREIDGSNLTLSQKIYLKLPTRCVKWIRKAKQALLHRGVRLTTFR